MEWRLDNGLGIRALVACIEVSNFPPNDGLKLVARDSSVAFLSSINAAGTSLRRTMPSNKCKVSVNWV